LTWVNKLEVQLARDRSKLTVSEALTHKRNLNEAELIANLIQEAARHNKNDKLVKDREQILQAKKRLLGVARCDFEETAAYFFIIIRIAH